MTISGDGNAWKPLNAASTIVFAPQRSRPRNASMHFRSLMHSMFDAAQRWELIDKNPISLVRVKEEANAVPSRQYLRSSSFSGARTLPGAVPAYGRYRTMLGVAGERERDDRGGQPGEPRLGVQRIHSASRPAVAAGRGRVRSKAGAAGRSAGVVAAPAG